MIRAYLGLAIGVAFFALAFGIYKSGQRSERVKQQLEIIETKDRINEAISDGVGIDWRDRLHNAQ